MKQTKNLCMNQKPIWNGKILPLVTVVLTFPVLITNNAWAAPPAAVPSAGTLLQQAQPLMPAAPSSTDTGLSIEQEGGSKLPPSAPFMVNAIQISGNTLFDTPTLHALVVDAEGKNLSLTQLGEFVDRITDFYRKHKYPLTRAFIPAQTIQAGVIRIEVIEARYDKITVDNHSGTSDSLLQRTLSSLQGGQPIEENALDHALLLVSDIPGVAANTTLKPGATVATSDLVVQATATAAMAGSVVADDYGNRYTGRERIGATSNFIDPLHQGDVLSLNLLTTGSDMNYGRLAYDFLLNGLGTRVGASYSAMHYTLGDSVSALGGHGIADEASLWVKQPFIRTRGVNLYGEFEYDHKKVDDDIDSTGIETDRQLNEATASLFGDWHDATGVNSWNLAATDGRVTFDNASAQLTDAASARTQGSFLKWLGNINRVQTINQNNTLYIAVSGQWANTNLDASEKMVAGGAYTVRAYDMGVLSGDIGILGNVEWRHELGQILSGQTQAIVFFDSEHLTIDQNAWAAGPNSATLSGTGVGFNWFGPSNSSIKATVAVPVGATPELLSANRSLRTWIELNLAF